MLRVLALTLSHRPVGTDHSLRNLARALHDHDAEVTLGGPGGTELADWWSDAGLTYRSLDLRPRSGFREPGPSRAAAMASRVATVAGQIGPTARTVRTIARTASEFDVLHSNWLFTHLDVAAAGRLSRTPSVLELHDFVPAGPGRALLNAAVVGANGTVAVSDAVRDQLGPRARRRTTTVHQAVDTDHFAPGPPDRRLRCALSRGQRPGLLVAVIGRLDPPKRVDMAIAAVARARSSGADVHLVVAGRPGEDDGGHAVALRAMAERHLPGAHVFIAHTADVASLLRTVDVVLVPSDAEPFGLIALEAQSCGTAVVVRDAGGLREFVSDGVDGFRADTVEEFAAVLVDLVDRPGLAESTAARARDRAVTAFGVDRRARQMLAQYRRATAGRR